MHKLTISQQVKALADKEFSSKELTQHYIKRIEAHDDKLNSFITFTPERALEAAEHADSRAYDGNSLNGIPIARQ